MTDLDAFLAGEHPEAVAIYLAGSTLQNAEALADRAERIGDGYALVLGGERGREVFSVVAGEPPMEFAQEASKREGAVDRDLAGGECPAAAGEGDSARGDEDDPASPDGDGPSAHEPRFALAFVQEETEEAGGRYAEGDVVHAYVRCSCGTAYADRWVLEESTDG